MVERLEDVREGFDGIACRRRESALRRLGELRQVTEGGAERVLARRNERDRLIAESERVVAEEYATREGVERALEQLRDAERGRDETDGALRDSERLLSEALEAQRKASWLIEQRKAAPEQGPLAVRRAELQGELAAERRQAERRRAEEAERVRRIGRLRAQACGRCRVGTPGLSVWQRRSRTQARAVGELLAQIQELLSQDHATGEQVSAELRACAQEEARDPSVAAG